VEDSSKRGRRSVRNRLRAKLTGGSSCIPIAYHADVDKALEVIESVAQGMSHSELWREQILDKPEVLGVDDFGIRGVIIRVWIKTQPLKQWVVAREFRRRLKVALDEAGISIPMPQQEVWFNNSLPLKSSLDDQGVSPNSSTKVL
jgi:moderate conductance mechanosensitive channel